LLHCSCFLTPTEGGIPRHGKLQVQQTLIRVSDESEKEAWRDIIEDYSERDKRKGKRVAFFKSLGSMWRNEAVWIATLALSRGTAVFVAVHEGKYGRILFLSRHFKRLRSRFHC
jgi:hypothetical protein